MKHGVRTLFLKIACVGAWILLLAGSAAPLSVRASSVIPPRDLGELAALSDAVVLARAGTAIPFARGGLISTRTRFEVLEVVRGAVPSQIDVETAGGVLDGVGWSVAGSPAFREGTVYLLFVNRRGVAWQPRMLAYGMLEQVAAQDGSVLLSHVREHHDLALLSRPDGRPAEPVETYYRDALVAHLRQVVQQRVSWDRTRVLVPRSLRPALHEDASKTAVGIPSPCVYIMHEDAPARWQSFDSSQTVQFYAESTGDADVPDDAEFEAVQQGINAWNSIESVAIDYHWAGTEAYTPDCSDGDAAPDNIAPDQGLVQFNDPCAEIPDLSATCSGTLAFGGIFFTAGSDGQHEHRAMQWNTVLVGFIIANNGVGACLSAAQYRIMITHELGHTLGFGHIPASQGSALMNPSCCTDLTEIDQQCALFAYSTLPTGNAPGTVSLAYPADEAPGEPTTPELAWNVLVGASTYHVQVATDPDFTNIIVEQVRVPRTVLQIGPLQGGTTYYWRVRAENIIGFGPWSTMRRFNTIFLTPAPVVLRWPPDAAVEQPAAIEFVWQEAANAERYQFQVSTTDRFTDLVVEDTGVTGDRRTVNDLVPGTTYYWRVRGINPLGQGPWSEVRRFSTESAPPAAIVPLTPADEATGLPVTPELAWQPDPLATVYHVQVSRAGDFSELAFEDAAVPAPAVEAGPLDDDASYYWRVRGINAEGPGPWSAVRRFATALRPPDPVALVSPDDEALDLPGIVTLAWQAAPRAAVYHVQVSRADDFSTLVFEEEAAASGIEVGPLAYSTQHYWRVRGLNAAGPGVWSDVRSFTLAIGTAAESAGDAPDAFRLFPNYPNPFNPVTTIRIELPSTAEVRLVVYDVLGRAVETLAAGVLPAGRYVYTWDAGERPSGIYLARFEADAFSQTRRMLLLK